MPMLRGRSHVDVLQSWCTIEPQWIIPLRLFAFLLFSFYGGQTGFDMDTLAFFAEPVLGSSNVFDVYWMISRSKRGAYRCVIDADVPSDHIVVAELSAIQYLLEYDLVLGEERAGNALSIVVSNGAIRKLSLFQSQKRHLVPYSTFLNTRFSDAVVSVGRGSLKNEFSWASALSDADKRPLVVDQALPELFQLFGVGSVRLSVHAVDAFLNRGGSLSRTDAWRELRNMAKDSSIRQLRLPRELVEKKLAKWGFPAIDLYHRGTDWHFVVSDDDLPRRLLSMYQLKVARPEVVEFSDDAPTLIGKGVLVAPAVCFSPPVFIALIDSLFRAGANIGLDAASRLAIGEERLAAFKRTRPGAIFFARLGQVDMVDPIELVRSVRRHFGALHHLVVAGISGQFLAEANSGRTSNFIGPDASVCGRLVHAAKRDVDDSCGVVLNVVEAEDPGQQSCVADFVAMPSLFKNEALSLEVKSVELALVPDGGGGHTRWRMRVGGGKPQRPGSPWLGAQPECGQRA
ncbi:hypothetical protein [Duganella vulcania]|uniref:Uncharacterized protein n=1 Tax=Duganella vulcania TaxID=2692166 RepID=A0A845GGT8_9BURK|nr:hypothetical protein [Duganella vulcania]MYM92730.1 hypothetical protein [Duganella vulcania]